MMSTAGAKGRPIAIVGPLLKARKAVEEQIGDLDRKVMKLARYDAQVRRFMTVEVAALQAHLLRDSRWLRRNWHRVPL
jgi:hypothetical protein